MREVHIVAFTFRVLSVLALDIRVAKLWSDPKHGETTTATKNLAAACNMYVA